MLKHVLRDSELCHLLICEPSEALVLELLRRSPVRIKNAPSRWLEYELLPALLDLDIIVAATLETVVPYQVDVPDTPCNQPPSEYILLYVRRGSTGSYPVN